MPDKVEYVTFISTLRKSGINVYAQLLSMIEYDKYNADCHGEGYLDVGVPLINNHARSS